MSTISDAKLRAVSIEVYKARMDANDRRALFKKKDHEKILAERSKCYDLLTKLYWKILTNADEPDDGGGVS